MRSPHAHEVSLLYTLASVTPCFPSRVIYVTSMDLCEDEAVTACITVTCKKAEEMNLHQIGPWGCEHGGAVHSGERVLETSWFEDFLTPCGEFLAWGKGRKNFFKDLKTMQSSLCHETWGHVCAGGAWSQQTRTNAHDPCGGPKGEVWRAGICTVFRMTSQH